MSGEIPQTQRWNKTSVIGNTAEKSKWKREIPDCCFCILLFISSGFMAMAGKPRSPWASTMCQVTGTWAAGSCLCCCWSVSRREGWKRITCWGSYFFLGVKTKKDPRPLIGARFPCRVMLWLNASIAVKHYLVICTFTSVVTVTEPVTVQTCPALADPGCRRDAR